MASTGDRHLAAGSLMAGVQRDASIVMRLALFAGGEVGREVAGFMAESSAPPIAVLVDANDSPAMKREIVRVAGIEQSAAFDSDQLGDESQCRRLRNPPPGLRILASGTDLPPQSPPPTPPVGVLDF